VAIRAIRAILGIVANPGLQGWAADPFGLHEARYFSAGQPTKLVRDGEAESFDDPPSGPDELAAASTRELARVAAADTATAMLIPEPFRLRHPDDADAVPHGHSPHGRYPHGRYPHGPGSGQAPRRRPWDATGWTAIGVLAAAALVLCVLVAETPKPVTTLNTGPAAAVAFVTQSAERTIAQRTADVTMTGTVSVAGTSIPISGSGEVDFSTNAMTLNSTVAENGHTLAQRQVQAGGNLYQSMTVDGQGPALPGGATWIQMPVAQAASANLTGSDPLASLTTLEQQGYAVQALGTKLVGDVNCTGFAVTPSTEAMIASARKEAAAAGLSPAMTSLELILARSMRPTITIWVDPGQLVREMSLSMQLPSFNGVPSSAAMVMDFSHFGVPVQISAPPAADTVSYAAYLKALGLGGTP
jgi:hypothetical protein